MEQTGKFSNGRAALGLLALVILAAAQLGAQLLASLPLMVGAPVWLGNVLAGVLYAALGVAGLLLLCGKGLRVTPEPGDYLKLHDRILPDGSEQINDEDMFLLGYVTPHSTGGMNNTFKYRNLSLSVYVDYALGHSVYNYMYTRGLQTSMGNCNWNLIYDANDCWQKPGDNTKLARLSANDADGGNKNYSRISDISVQKGDYLCLRDVTLSYSFPKRWIGKLGLGNLTVSVSGNTLVYWTKVKGVSPESAVAASGSSTGMYSVVNTSSADYSIYPPTRKVMFSLKATF